MFKIDKQKLIGLEIKTVHQLLKRDFDKLIITDETKNLTSVQKWVLCYLSDHIDEDVFQRDLEEEFSIRRSTATGILQLMEKSDLITREPVPYDARLKKIVLTERACKVQDEIHKKIKEHHNRLTKGINPDEIEVFLNVMEKIKQNLD